MRNCRLVLTAEGHKAFEAAYEAALGTEGVRTLETLLAAIQQAT